MEDRKIVVIWEFILHFPNKYAITEWTVLSNFGIIHCWWVSLDRLGYIHSCPAILFYFWTGRLWKVDVQPYEVKNNIKNPQLNVGNDVGWLFGLQVLIRKSKKCKNKFSQKLFRETLMVLDTDPILAYGLVVQNDLIHKWRPKWTVHISGYILCSLLNTHSKALYFDIGWFDKTFTTEAARQKLLRQSSEWLQEIGLPNVETSNTI